MIQGRALAFTSSFAPSVIRAAPRAACKVRYRRVAQVPTRGVALMSSTDATTAPAGSPSAPAIDAVVQYVVVRRDLVDELSWPTGSVIAQAVHASVAAVWESRYDAVTGGYCAESGGAMHTVVLEAKNEAAITRLAERLHDGGIEHVMWREQPENIVTALAAKPYPRSVVKPMFNKFKLFK